MPPDDQPGIVGIPLVWVGIEDVPIMFANALMCQFDNDLSTFIFSAGQVTPPPLSGTPAELAEQVSNLEFLQVKPIARLSLSRDRVRELVAVLEASLDQCDRASRLRPGDPRR